MSKAFLSHSSFDKDFVDQVFDQLGAGRCVYDKSTFKRNADLALQIREGLEGCDIYVLFLSASALNSKWVTAELDVANELKTRWSITRFLVFQLDDTPWTELPQWLGRYVVSSPPSPGHVALRILDELRPHREYAQNCIGRSDAVQSLISDLDELDAPPSYIYLSGPIGIGRRTLAEELYRTYYHGIGPNKISLPVDVIDGIADIYQRALAFSANWRARDYKRAIDQFCEHDTSRQIEVLADLLFDIATKFRQVVIIDLGASALTEEGRPQGWFEHLTTKLKKADYPYIWFLSQRFLEGRDLENGLFVSVPPLSEKWSATLFKVLIKQFSISFPSKDEQASIEEIISGHPGLISIVANYLRKNPNYKPNRTHNNIIKLIHAEVQKILSDFVSNDCEREKAVGLFSEAHVMSYEEVILISKHWRDFDKHVEELIDAGLVAASGADYFLVAYIHRAASAYATKYRAELDEPRRLLLNSFDSLTEDSYVPVSLLDARIVERITNGDEASSFLSNLIMPSQQIKAARRNYNSKNYSLSLSLARAAYGQSTKLSQNGQREAWRLIGFSAIRGGDEESFEYFKSEYVRLPRSAQTESNYYFANGLKARLEGNLRQSLEWYEKVDQSKFADAHVYRELGYIYAFERNFDKAVSCVTRALDLGFGNPYILDLMVMILIEQYKAERSTELMSRIDESLRELRQADNREGTNFHYPRSKMRDVIANNDTASLYELYARRRDLPISAQTALLDMLSYKGKDLQYSELSAELTKVAKERGNQVVEIEVKRITFEHLAYKKQYGEAQRVMRMIKGKLTQRCIEDMNRLLPGEYRLTSA